VKHKRAFNIDAFLNETPPEEQPLPILKEINNAGVLTGENQNLETLFWKTSRAMSTIPIQSTRRCCENDYEE
jgi:hypothetical protein